MSGLKYKGYTARIEFDADDHIFVGHLAGVRDIVGFHGSSVKELERAFRQAVDDYLDACERLGQKPNKPVSGKLLLRLPEDVHAAVAATAEASGKSLNQWASEVLRKAAHV